jgi:hypothetical protein
VVWSAKNIPELKSNPSMFEALHHATIVSFVAE